MRRDAHQIAGLAIATVLMVITIMFVLGGAMVTMSLQHLNEVSTDVRDRQAFYAATAGIEQTLANLTLNPDSKAGLPLTVMAASQCTFSTIVYNNTLGSTSMPPVPAGFPALPAGVVVPPHFVYVLSTGTDGSGSATPVTRQASVMMQQPSVFNFGFFTDGLTSFGASAIVDGFDSSLGPYDPSKVNTFTSQVAVGTNSAVAGSISGGTTINGNASSGPGSDPSTAVTSVLINGGVKQSLSRPNTLNVQNPPAGTPDSGTLKGGTTLDSAHSPYYFSGGANVQGNPVIINSTPGNPVTVYFDGVFTMGGNASLGVNPTGKPTDLIIFGTSKATTLKFNGNANLIAGFFAPTVDIVPNGAGGAGQFIGAVIGKSYGGNGHPDVHVDVALSRTTFIGNLTLTSFQRF